MAEVYLDRMLEQYGCAFKGSPICRYVRGEVRHCNECEIGSLKRKERVQMAVEYYQEQGVLNEYPVHIGEEGTCALCRGEQRNEATTKAYAKIANHCLDGKRVTTGVGNLVNGGEIDIEAPACEKCMKNIQKASRGDTVILTLIVLAAVALAFCLNAFVVKAKTGVLPMLVTIGVALLAFGCFTLLHRANHKRIEKRTCLQVLDLPGLEDWAAKGWYVRTENTNKPTLHTSRPKAHADFNTIRAATEGDMQVYQQKRREKRR